jgi:streptogramin lyase
MVRRGLALVLLIALAVGGSPAVAGAEPHVIEPSGGFLVDQFINAGDTLLIRQGVSVTFTGTAQNFGTIVNLGSMTVLGVVNNNNGGRIDNAGSIKIEEARVIDFRKERPRSGVIINWAGSVINNDRSGYIEAFLGWDPGTPNAPRLDNRAGATLNNRGEIALFSIGTFGDQAQMLSNAGTLTIHQSGSLVMQSGIFTNRGGIVTNLGLMDIYGNDASRDPVFRNADEGRIRNRGILASYSVLGSGLLSNYGGVLRVFGGIGPIVRNWGKMLEYWGITCGDALPPVAESRRCEDEDLDSDDILDVVDDDLTAFSNNFSDLILGAGPFHSGIKPAEITGTGKTTGRVVSRPAGPGGTRIVPVISEEPNPDFGVRIGAIEKPGVIGQTVAASLVFEIKAVVSLCNDSSQIRVDPGDEVIATCGIGSAVNLSVVNSQVETQLKILDSVVATSTLAAGDEVSFDPITSHVRNTGAQSVQLVLPAGRSVTIEPGQTASLRVQQADLLVGSFFGGTVLRYSETGSPVGIFATGGGVLGPAGFALGPDGHLYVAGQSSHNVVRFDRQTGAVIDVFVETGSGGLTFPSGLTFGPDGHLYVVSLGTDEVLRFDGATGEFINAFVTTRSGGLDNPFQLVFGPDGYLFVSSPVNQNVLRFHGLTGAFIDVFATGNGLSSPGGLAFGPDGHLYVASGANDRVLRFDGGTGAFIDAFVAAGSGGLDDPVGLVFGVDGHLYVTSFGTDQVLQFDGTTGAFIDVFVAAGSEGLDGPGLLAFLPPIDGVADRSGGSIQDTESPGASITLAPNLLADPTLVTMNVIYPGAALTPPAGLAGPATFFVEFALAPSRSPLARPGATITLPLANRLTFTKPEPVFLFELDRATGALVDTGIVGRLDPQTGTATFEGVVQFSILVGFVDREAPNLTLSLRRDSLAPPNLAMVDVGLATTVTDNRDRSPRVAIAVTSDEPTTAASGGAVNAPDAFVTDGSVMVRAERSGTGDGRVYVITVTVIDASGNRRSSHAAVEVRLRRNQNSVDSGQRFVATESR